MRVHGESPHREMWEFGGETSDAYKAQLKIDQLRYRMLPFWYSLAGDVTQNDTTFMRPLVMDFPDDPAAREIDDEYVLGSGLLVSPVTTYKTRTRSIYLPGVGVGWYDFWNGGYQAAAKNRVLTEAGLRTDTPAPYDQIPLHVRAGTILPLGPDLQYTTEKKADPLTLLVYTGADAKFSLYEDDGLTYQYEKSMFTRIPMAWDETSQTLTLGRRLGAFPGMLNDRTINVVFITPQKAVGYTPDMKPDRVVKYAGDSMSVKP
jgi:alpha-D-xyloside xylohydrolase